MPTSYLMYYLASDTWSHITKQHHKQFLCNCCIQVTHIAKNIKSNKIQFIPFRFYWQLLKQLTFNNILTPTLAPKENKKMLEILLQGNFCTFYSVLFLMFYKIKTYLWMNAKTGKSLIEKYKKHTSNIISNARV